MSNGITVYLDEETLDVVESLKQASRERSDMWDMSQSEAGRELIEHGIENLSENPDLEEMIDDLDLKVWRNQQKQDDLQKQGRIAEMQGGWRGRVRDRLNKRLAGPEPYDPEIIDDLLELYWSEIEVWEEDEDRLDEHREWLDQVGGQYADAFEAKQILPDDGFDVIDDVEVGSDILSLRGSFGDLLAEIEARADSQAYDPDAIVRSLAAENAVDEEAIEIVLDVVTPDDVDPRQMLKDLETSDVDDLLPDRVISGGDQSIDQLAAENGDRADTPVAAIRLDPDDLDDAEPEIDPDEVEDVVEGELVGDGGESADD